MLLCLHRALTHVNWLINRIWCNNLVLDSYAWFNQSSSDQLDVVRSRQAVNKGLLQTTSYYYTNGFVFQSHHISLRFPIRPGEKYFVLKQKKYLVHVTTRVEFYLIFEQWHISGKARANCRWHQYFKSESQLLQLLRHALIILNQEDSLYWLKGTILCWFNDKGGPREGVLTKNITSFQGDYHVTSDSYVIFPLEWVRAPALL